VISLSAELDRYLAVRRGLGYDLRTSERVLRRFIAFAERAGAGHVTTDLFLRWRESFGHAGRATWAARLGMVRLFAQWLHGIDPRHQVPPGSLVPGHHRRARPYIYAEQEVGRLVAAAAGLRSAHGLRGPTYATLFGLIAATGLRVGEAVALDVADVDLASGVLTVRRGKGGTQRLVPVSDDVRARLAAYAAERDRLLGRRPEPFFASDAGTRPTDCAVRYNFAVVCQAIGLRPAQRYHRHGRGPRIHDLRHTFAVHTMLDWHRAGRDVDREMVRLAAYLGHAGPASTYWYVEAVPELLALALASERAHASLAREGHA
jgi:integrase/recombinase XerD